MLIIPLNLINSVRHRAAQEYEEGASNAGTETDAFPSTAIQPRDRDPSKSASPTSIAPVVSSQQSYIYLYLYLASFSTFLSNICAIDEFKAATFRKKRGYGLIVKRAKFYLNIRVCVLLFWELLNFPNARALKYNNIFHQFILNLIRPSLRVQVRRIWNF